MQSYYINDSKNKTSEYGSWNYKLENKKNNSNDCELNCLPDKVIFNCKPISGLSNIQFVLIGNDVEPPGLQLNGIDLIRAGTGTIGSIRADLTCLSKPCVGLSISAIISSNVITATVGGPFTVIFRVFKRCGCEKESEIASFTVTQIAPAGSVGLTQSIPVKFIVCDCNTCSSGCCIYRIQVEGVAVGITSGTFSINEGAISIIGTNLAC